MMKEIRNLTKEELSELIKDAPLTETKFLRESGVDIYEFFNSGFDVEGLIINKRPIYIAMIRKGISGNNIFWTVVNRDVTDKITLCKEAKRYLSKWVNKYKSLYATMEKINQENIKWVKWLGFKTIEEDNDYITFKIGE